MSFPLDLPLWLQGPRVPFVNTSNEAMPPFGIGAVVKRVWRYGIEVYEIEKPGTTFRDEYIVNGMSEIAANGRGLGYDYDSTRLVAYDAGTPVEREWWGVKSGQWTMTSGGVFLFEIGVLHPHAPTNKWAIGRFCPLVYSMLGKTTAAATAGTPTTSYRIYGGATLGSEADLGFTTVPSAVSRVNIDNGKWIRLTRLSKGFEMEPLECSEA